MISTKAKPGSLVVPLLPLLVLKRENRNTKEKTRMELENRFSLITLFDL